MKGMNKMAKNRLLAKVIDFTVIGAMLCMLSLPANAADDVVKSKQTVLENFDSVETDNLSQYAEVWWNDNTELNLIDNNGDKEIAVTLNGKNIWNPWLVLKPQGGNFNLKNESEPYLVFSMKVSGLEWGGFRLRVSYNGGEAIAKKGCVLEQSKDFSNPANEIKTMVYTGDADTSYFENNSSFYVDNEEFEYRINLKEAFSDVYDSFGCAYAFHFNLANANSSETPVTFTFDNFRIESGNGAVYQTFDGISNADDVAWYHNGFSAAIENVGYLGSPALKLTGKGNNANTQIVFDRGNTVNLLANGNYLYWYMDVDVDTYAAGFNYKPEYVNACIKILTESWKGDEGLIWDDTKITYAGSLSGVLNGAGTSLPNWNGNQWGLRLPVGKHWFCIDLTKAFKSDYTEEDIKTSLKQAKSLYLQYNIDQEDENGNWNWKSFADVEATFIIDSISTLTQDFADGDANCDGTVDILDLVRVKKYATGIQTEICAAADLDGNLAIDAEDLILLRKVLLEK
jgi:hypothetical protein